MKVIVFEPDYDEKHQVVLRALARGIPGAVVRDVREYEPCDIAVVFGSVKYSFPKTWSKKTILEQHQGRQLLMVESAFVRRGEYWQVGWGGFSGHADFCNEDVPMDRWESFGIKSRPWQRRSNGPFVVCGQLPRDTQVQDVDHVAWCQEAVKRYQDLGYKVRFRPHPKEKDPSIYGIDESLYDIKKLKLSLKEARCYVTWNSTSGVDAGIAGVPVIACDQGSMAWSIAAHGLGEPLRYPSRRKWLAGIGYAQWTLEEMESGRVWSHLNQFRCQ